MSETVLPLERDLGDQHGATLRGGGMTAEPLISVILPTFNRATLLPRAMASVLNQDYTKTELIIVDDGSTDDTTVVVDSISDSRIRYLRLMSNGGPGRARNMGIRLARGSLVAFQDSDDEWIPGKLTKQLQAIETEGDLPQFVYTGFWREAHGYRKYIPTASQIARKGGFFRALLCGNFIGMPTLLVSRSCLALVGGFDETMQSLEDWDWVLRLSRVAKGTFVNEPLVVVHDSLSGVNSQTAAVKVHSLETIRRRYASEFERDKHADSEMELGLALSLCRERSIRFWGPSVVHYAKACVRDPSNAEAWVLLVASLTGPGSAVGLQALRHRVLSRRVDIR